MKLKKAYFCRKCNEEIKLKLNEIKRVCPHCGYVSDWGKTSVVFEWFVEEKPDFKKINYEEIVHE